MKSRQWMTAPAMMAVLVSTSAFAVPTRYIVFTMDVDDRVQPVFYTEVELAAPSPASNAAVATASMREESVAYHAWRHGKDLGEQFVTMPNLRGEFAHDPEHGDGSIDAYAVAKVDRSFVMRIPVADADALEFAHKSSSQRIDLDMLAASARTLSLAASMPALQIAREPSSGNSANRLDLLVVGDGYTSAQQSQFNTDATVLHDSFFGLTPYHEYQSFVNWTTGFVASVQSGADHPPYQSGCSNSSCCSDPSANGDPLGGQYVNTAFNAQFCTSQIQRLVTVNQSLVLAAAAAYPGWDKIFVVVNDATYGGSGGNISVTSTHAQAKQIILHEFGHSFSHLADEYSSAYPGFPGCSDISGNALCEPNVTNQTIAAQVKWATWFTPGNAIPTPSGHAGVGLFQGARYLTTGMYRPVDQECLMQYLGKPFCPVCRQEYVRTLYRGGFGVPVNGIDLIEPGTESPSTATEVSYPAGTNQVFQATLLQPTVGTLDVHWYLDGNPINAATSSSYTFSQVSASPTTHTLELRAKDLTTFVAPSMAGALLDHKRTWTIHVVNSDDTIFKNGFD
ncbi:MAG: M64 family metallopeptidase [Dokdonella sp.]